MRQLREFVDTERRAQILKRLNSILTVPIFLIGAILPLSPSFSIPAHSKALSEGEPTVTALVLKQNHRPIGRLEVVITKTALKIFCQDFGTDILASAPDWHVAYYNPSSRLMRNFSYGKFSSYGTALSACGEYPELNKSKSSRAMVAGVNADCYQAPDKSEEITEVCVSSANDIDPKIIAILTKLYRLPNIGRLPLAAHSISQRHESTGATAWLPGKEVDGKTHRYYRLQTFSIKQEKRSASDFKYPIGFKETNDESAISFAHRADGLIDFLTGEGSGKPTSKPQATPIHPSKK